MKTTVKFFNNGKAVAEFQMACVPRKGEVVVFRHQDYSVMSWNVKEVVHNPEISTVSVLVANHQETTQGQ